MVKVCQSYKQVKTESWKGNCQAILNGCVASPACHIAFIILYSIASKDIRENLLPHRRHKPFSVYDTECTAHTECASLDVLIFTVFIMAVD